MGVSKLVFSFFLFFISFSSSVNHNHKCPDEQRDALLVFKQNIISSNNTSYVKDRYCMDLHGSRFDPVKINWKTSVDCCDWYGISCDKVTGDVISLDLDCQNLRGVLELDILLFGLPKLSAIDLSYNLLSVVARNYTGYVNSHLYELRLASCNLTVFPNLLRAMKNLGFLDLSRNFISGQVPAWAGEYNLTYLDLSENSIRGSFPLWICNMKHLKYLDVSTNRISGTLPQCLQNISSSLVSLDVSSNMIQGLFPTTICNMGSLSYLDVSYNSISGTLPQCLQNISSSLVSLDVSSNMIQGPFPTTICNMGRLLYLVMSNNNFHGVIPQCLQNISSSLVSLDVSSNMIQGPFPTTICNMGSLSYLDMSYNNFHGVIPQCLQNITSSLELVDLGKNKFNGTIPEVYGNCGVLVGLILNGNKLEGKVPRSLENCKSLKVLELGNNRLDGTFPGWLGYLLKLQVLILRSNNFHGTIETPSAVEFLFPSLSIFDISNNGFVGRLPEKYFESFNAIKDVDKEPKTNIIGLPSYTVNVTVKGVQIWDRTSVAILYAVIDLSCNKFEGEIPNIIGNLKSLKLLNLSNNNLSGQIPHVLGNLDPLELLDLSRNQLEGEIPQSLANLYFLAVLNLSQNHLVGRIPVGHQFNTFDWYSYLGNPGLCGLPLAQLCEDPQVEEKGGEWIYVESVMSGLGFGTLIGVVLGYGMLSTGRPKWVSAIADAGVHIGRKKRKHVHIRKQK